MSKNTVFKVKENFNLTSFAEQLAEKIKLKGYTVEESKLNNSCHLIISKDNDGIQKFAGLGQYIEASISLSKDTLTISYSNEDWLMKIVAIGIGWFFCLVPFFTGIFGAVKQMNLSKEITNDARLIVSEMQ